MANKKLFPVDFFGNISQNQDKITTNSTGKDHPKILNPLTAQKKNFDVIQEIKEEKNEESTNFSIQSKFGLKISVPDSTNDESIKHSSQSPIILQEKDFFSKKNIENDENIQTCINNNTINIIFSNKSDEEDILKMTPHFNYFEEVNKKDFRRPMTPKMTNFRNSNVQKNNFVHFKFNDTDKKNDISFNADDISNINNKNLKTESNKRISTSYNNKTHTQKKEKNYKKNFSQYTLTENNIISKNTISNTSKKSGNNFHNRADSFSRKTKRAKTYRNCNTIQENHISNNSKNNKNKNNSTNNNNSLNKEKKNVSRPNSVAQKKKISYNINNENNNNLNAKKKSIKDNGNSDIYLPFISINNDRINLKNIDQIKIKRELKNIFRNLNDNCFKDPEINKKFRLIMKNLKDIKNIQEILNKKKSPLKLQKQKKNNNINMVAKRLFNDEKKQ